MLSTSTRSSHDLAQAMASSCELLLLAHLEEHPPASDPPAPAHAAEALRRKRDGDIEAALQRLNPVLAAARDELDRNPVGSRLVINGLRADAPGTDTPDGAAAGFAARGRMTLVDYASRGVGQVLAAGDTAGGQPVAQLSRALSCAAAGACVGLGSVAVITGIGAPIGAFVAGFGLGYGAGAGCLD